ncbi:phospholipase-like protein [Artemisia annua]|uniref:Phospholipase-like protein n=1 Tax=Artemisia annua TaxID=35608 RepID=A0A2U1MTP7_ARTAN|nr:phospholipase-like protein [Artemisia annua]
MGYTSTSDFTFELINNNAAAGKELVHVLQQLEKRLEKVQQMPPESTKHAMQPAIKKLIATELLRHPDVEVNISVAGCICEVFRIMVHELYNDEKMKDFFELVVITFEKLSATSGGCYDKMTKVLRTLSSGNFSVMMCDLQLDGLIVRLFKQFLTVADSNSAVVVIKMKQIMAMIIEKTELPNHKLVDLLVNSVREDNKTSSPVCWQLGRDVLMKCAAQLKPHLPKKVAEEFYSPLMETIPSTTGTSRLRKDVTRKRKLECLDGSRNMVQAVRRCGDVKKHKKKSLSTDDPPMPTNIVTEVVEEFYSPLMETIPSTTDTRKLEKEVTCKRKLECLDGSRNMVQPVRRCRDVRKRKKKSLSTDDLPMPTNIVTKAQSVEQGENLVGRRIKVWWSRDKVYYQGVVKSFDCRNKRHKVLYDDGVEEILDFKQGRWKLVKMASKLSTFDIKLMNAGKGLLVLPSSTAKLLNVLEKMEKLLHRVQLHKGKRKQKLSESMKYAMHPIIEALAAKELLRHLDMDVNISVACCICDLLRIMEGNAAYTNEQMKDFFELAVTTFEKLSSTSGGCYTKLFKVLKTLSCFSYSVLESDLQLNGLIIRLFKQFLTVAE